MKACYLDASALVKLAIREAETAALRDHLGAYEARMTSRVAQVELSRAFLRRGDAGGSGTVAIPDVMQNVSVIELDAELARRAGGLEPPALRSLDAIHLASALALGDELDAFVTYDTRLADAARAAGIAVVSPA